jgi:hypothetical protein
LQPIRSDIASPRELDTLSQQFVGQKRIEPSDVPAAVHILVTLSDSVQGIAGGDQLVELELGLLQE